MKDNQPALKQDIALAFDASREAALCPWERRLAEQERQRALTVNKGHGRIEERTIVSTTALNDYLDWPDVGQVFRCERRRTVKKRTSVDIAYGITSLDRRRADARTLLTLCREHWGIENRLFLVRDVTMGEDACRIRSGAAPQALAALRNACLYLLRAAGRTNIAAALRRHAAKPYEALGLIRAPPEN